jgi:hypothetical protein
VTSDRTSCSWPGWPRRVEAGTLDPAVSGCDVRRRRSIPHHSRRHVRVLQADAARLGVHRYVPRGTCCVGCRLRPCRVVAQAIALAGRLTAGFSVAARASGSWQSADLVVIRELTGTGSQDHGVLYAPPNASTNSAFVPSDTPASYDPTAHENRGVIDRQAPGGCDSPGPPDREIHPMRIVRLAQYQGGVGVPSGSNPYGHRTPNCS